MSQRQPRPNLRRANAAHREIAISLPIPPSAREDRRAATRLPGPARWRLAAVALLSCGGCGGANVGLRLGELEPGSQAEKRAIVADPWGYIQVSEQRAARLKHYRLEFHRQERLGLIPTLRPLERMTAEYREQPFSVKFTWLGDESEYREAVYVAGRNHGKVLLLPRHGLLGLPPRVAAYDPGDAVTFWRSRHPITEFGLHRMIARTLERARQSRRYGDVSIAYLGQRTVEGVLAHHFDIRYPPDDPYPNKRQDLFIDVARGLPLGTSLWLPDGALDATYLYLRPVLLDQPQDDTAFTISPAPRGPKTAAKTAT